VSDKISITFEQKVRSKVSTDQGQSYQCEQIEFANSSTLNTQLLASLHIANEEKVVVDRIVGKTSAHAEVSTTVTWGIVRGEKD